MFCFCCIFSLDLDILSMIPNNNNKNNNKRKKEEEEKVIWYNDFLSKHMLFANN